MSKLTEMAIRPDNVERNVDEQCKRQTCLKPLSDLHAYGIPSWIISGKHWNINVFCTDHGANFSKFVGKGEKNITTLFRCLRLLFRKILNSEYEILTMFYSATFFQSFFNMYMYGHSDFRRTLREKEFNYFGLLIERSYITSRRPYSCFQTMKFLFSGKLGF